MFFFVWANAIGKPNPLWIIPAKVTCTSKKRDLSLLFKQIISTDIEGKTKIIQNPSKPKHISYFSIDSHQSIIIDGINISFHSNIKDVFSKYKIESNKARINRIQKHRRFQCTAILIKNVILPSDLALESIWQLQYTNQ
ncbi:hypothetical protein KIL84_013325 [Mauremys mutica]|uniref:Uncharacterized protein n=1 Tax=Mauremys mutica TaxID=74926 RepID=A0A9D4AU83_9SAUR|nr:hypothetical protein KIL84_013325 [Mauremys mutica]